MEETLWMEALAASDPSLLLEYLQTEASERKRRLFAAGCCRRVFRFIPLECKRWKGDPAEYFQAVEKVEKYADGLATQNDLRNTGRSGDFACDAVLVAAARDEWADALTTVSTWVSAAVVPPKEPYLIPWDANTGSIGPSQFAEQAAHCDLIRCIFGNPFRPVAFDSRWRSETAVALSSAIYSERAFDRLPILADALEEAGCDHPDILTHCREPGPHARGCWVVDGVLGK
jgi:hypothetical protein